jgi:hypothetical protein
MNRKTLGALLIFVLLLGIVYYLQTRPEKGQRTGERKRPLGKLDKSRINKVTITSKGKTVVLQRGPKQSWRLTAPVSYEADKSAAEAMLEKLARLEFGDMVTEQRSRHSEHEVDDKTGVHVAVTYGAKTVADFYLGKVIDSFTMFRIKDKDQVYQAVGSLRYAFDREVKSWRNRTIINLKPEEARELRVTTSDGTIVFSRPDGKAAWSIKSAPIKIDQLDTSIVNNLVSTFQSLTAFDFADETTSQRAGLDQPVATIVATVKEGKQVALLVGNHEGDDYRVQRRDNPQIFVVKKYSVVNLMRRPVDFKDKSVLSLKADEVTALVIDKRKDKTSMTLKRKGGEWLVDGKQVKDDTKVKAAVDTLASLKAEGFARETAAELGLDKPDWVVEVQMKDRTKHVISVGSVEREGLWGVIREGIDDLFTLRKYILDKFLLDPKDYT